MKIKGAKKVHYDSGPNMTPLVDVVMVILIFLMLVGTFGGAEHHLASNMPISPKGLEGGAQTSPTLDEVVDIWVDSPSPDRFIARHAQVVNATDEETLFRQLDQLRRTREAAGTKIDEVQVKISPGKNTRYEHVIAVQEAATRAGFKKIGFTTAH